MAKIRKFRPTDIKKIRQMIEFVDAGIASSLIKEENFSFFPLDLLHGLLPVNLRFMQENYVAVENNEILGLIGLVPDGKKKTRWKINRLILNSNSYDVGKQLIYYIFNKFGGAGVETFITSIDERNAEAIDLFKNNCGFRSCSKVHIYESNYLQIDENFTNIDNLRPFKSSDKTMLLELDQQALFPQYRMSLTKDLSDFKFGLKNKIINYFRGYKVKRLVLDNPAKKSIEGYILVMTNDNKNFWADIVVSLPYQTYYDDIVSYITRYVKYQNNDAKLFIYSRKYYQGNENLIEVLSSRNFKVSQGFQMLVKDYWNIVKPESDTKKSPIIIFPDITSPACNINRIID